MRPSPPLRVRARSTWLPLLAGLLLLASAQARFEWRDVVQDVAIGADGGVTVRDERTLWTDEDFGEAFICVGHDGAQRLTLLDGSGAVSAGPSATAFQQPCSAGTEVVVRQSERVSERRVRFVYRLDGTVEPFSDVVQWYWNLIQLDHPPIRGYRLTVTAPGPMSAPYDAYVMRYANLEVPRVALSEDRRVLTVAFDRIPTGDGVEVRYLMDPALFTVSSGRPGFEALLRDQARISGVQERDRLWRSLRGHPAWGLLPLAWILWLVVGIFSAWQRVGREPRTDGMRYPFEPPRDLPPAAVTAMMEQSFNAAGMGAGWFATIMDLARRGYARFDGDGKSLKIVLDAGRDRGPLESFEQQVLDYLRSAAAAGQRRGGAAHEVTLAQLETYGRSHAQTFLTRWGPLVRKWVEGFLGGPLVTAESRAVSHRWAGRAALALLAGGLLAFLTLDAARGIAIAAAVAAGALAITALGALPAWRPEVARERAGWLGFKRTLTDYTRMKDAPPDFFLLWDRYYAYAAALGVAERFLRTLQRVAPARGIDQDQMVRQARWMGSANANGLKGMASAVNSLSASLAKAGASASGGGSSSGGGGGGGGGGSSGGR
jgi:uncharacterized membrane protein YgcG